MSGGLLKTETVPLFQVDIISYHQCLLVIEAEGDTVFQKKKHKAFEYVSNKKTITTDIYHPLAGKKKSVRFQLYELVSTSREITLL